MAVLAAVFTGCSDDNDPTYFGEIRVSQSYVSLSTSGGSTSINIEATGSWSVSGAPDWLTVSPASGTGSGTITFSADAAEGRTAEVLISCEGKTQHINVIQGIATVSNATCAEVIAGPDSKTYRVSGTVTAIANTTYGNWYMNDGTGEVYIYGTLDKNGGEKNFLSLGIEVGDEVTVEGPKTTYNGTVELVNVTVVKINKSLIKVDSLAIGGETVAEAILPLEGGEATAYVSCKGDGINVGDLPEWLVISAISSNTVTFRAMPNAGGDRNTTVTLKTYNGGKEYTSQFNIAQAGSSQPRLVIRSTASRLSSLASMRVTSRVRASTSRTSQVRRSSTVPRASSTAVSRWATSWKLSVSVEPIRIARRWSKALVYRSIP